MGSGFAHPTTRPLNASTRVLTRVIVISGRCRRRRRRAWKETIAPEN